jgi:hypothetical protein
MSGCIGRRSEPRAQLGRDLGSIRARFSILDSAVNALMRAGMVTEFQRKTIHKRIVLEWERANLNVIRKNRRKEKGENERAVSGPQVAE